MCPQNPLTPAPSGWPWSRLLGGLLLAMALTVLLIDSRSAVVRIGRLPLFLLCFVPGALLAGGIIGRPRGLSAQRHALARRIAAGGWRPVEITPRVFRYRVGRWASAILVTLAAGFLVGGAALFAIMWPDARLGPVAAAGLGGGLALFGLLLLLYLHRFRRIHIRVDEGGLHAQGLLGRADIPWHQVISVSSLDVTGGLGPVGTVHRVHGLTATIEFYDSLDGADDLRAIIRRAVPMSSGVAR